MISSKRSLPCPESSWGNKKQRLYVGADARNRKTKYVGVYIYESISFGSLIVFNYISMHFVLFISSNLRVSRIELSD